MPQLSSPSSAGRSPDPPTPMRARLRRRLRSRRATVEDRSMEPAFLPGDRLWFDPDAYRIRPPRPGDVVVVDDPDGSGRLLLKRVAATERSRVWVIRDGVLVADPASPTTARPSDAIDEIDVPIGQLFVTSDRRLGTRDSRTFGPVPSSSVAGLVWYRYAPARRRGRVGSSG